MKNSKQVIKRCLKVRNKIRILADHLRLFTFIRITEYYIYIFYNNNINVRK